MRVNGHARAWLLCSTALGSCPSPAALAAGEGLAEVVVTARKRVELLQQTPVAVTAVTMPQLEARGVADLADVGPLAPNVIIRSGGVLSGTSSAASISIRGIGQSDFTINTDPAVGVYLDGVYLGRTLGSLLDLTGVERVEVLRGPQGTLFGRNAIGGAISVVSAAPKLDTTSASVGLTGGERGYRQVRAVANLPLGDRAALRISGVHRHRDGFVDALQYENLRLGGEASWTLRAGLRLQATDALTLDLVLDHGERRDPPAAVVALDLGDLSAGNTGSTGGAATFFNTGRGPRPPAYASWASSAAPRCAVDAAFRDSSRACYGAAWLAGTLGNNSVWVDSAGRRVEPRNGLDASGASLTATWELGSVLLKSITARRDFSAAFYNDLDFTPYVIFHNNHEQPFEQRQLSQELQLAGDAFGGRLDYLVGAYGFDERGTEAIDLLAPGEIPPPLAASLAAGLPRFQHTPRRIANTSLAFFAHGVIALSDRLELSAGARWSRDEKDYAVELRRVAGSVPPSRGVQRSEEWTPTASLAFDLTPEVLTYVTYARGYRQGGFAARFLGGLPNPLPSFAPEFVDSYEVGLKSRWFEDRLVVNAAAFRTDYSDIQVNATTPVLPGFTLNLASAQLTGFEIEVAAELGAGLSFEGSAGYVHDDVTDVAPGTVTHGGTNVATPITADSALPGPDWQLRAGIAHRLALPRGQLRSRLELFHEGVDDFDIANLAGTRREGFETVEASVAFTSNDDRWTIAAGAHNLFDRIVFTNIAMSSPTGALLGSLSRRREVYGQLTYRFGHRDAP
jgi:iron complex outermembrane receptor protein